MDLINYALLSVLYIALFPAWTKEENSSGTQQYTLWEDHTSRQDIQRVLLGVIVLELTIIIILLGVCIKITTPKADLKRNDDDKRSSDVHNALPSFHLSTVRNTKQNKLDSHRDDKRVIREGGFGGSSRSLSKHVYTDEDLLLHKDFQLDSEVNGHDAITSHSRYGSKQNLTERSLFETTGDITHNNDYDDRCLVGSVVSGSQISKLKTKTLPRDFML